MLNIAFEGMPGSGKTSIVTYLINYLNSKFILLPEINHHRLNQKSVRDTSLWIYYHCLWKERINCINNIKRDLNFVYDRTYYTNLAYEYACGNFFRYREQKKNITMDFEKGYFDCIFVLDVSPSIGIKRRLLNGDVPPNPWDNICFLERLRDFYKNELKDIFYGKIFFIETDEILLNKIKIEIKNLISKHLPQIKLDYKNYYKMYLEPSTKRSLLQFSQKEMLGKPYTNVLDVLGYPTMYFRQYALQLEPRGPTYLDTSRLKKIISCNMQDTIGHLC